MGIISIMLGIIAFIGFTGAGAVVANRVIELKASFAMTLTTLNSISNTSVMIGVTAVFAFVGLLLGISLIMLGLNYNKLSKIQRRLRNK